MRIDYLEASKEVSVSTRSLLGGYKRSVCHADIERTRVKGNGPSSGTWPCEHVLIQTIECVQAR